MLKKLFQLGWLNKKSAAADKNVNIEAKTTAKPRTAEPASQNGSSTINTPSNIPVSLDGISDIDSLLGALLQCREKQRQTLLETFNDEILLRQLGKHADKLDKRSNQLVREKLKALRDKEQSEKDLQERIKKLCQRLESLGRTQYNAAFDSELFYLQKTWQHTLKETTQSCAALVERGNSALSNCEAIKQHAADMAAEQARIAAEREAEKQTEAITAVPDSLADATAEEQPSTLLAEIDAARKALDEEKQRLLKEKQEQEKQQKALKQQQLGEQLNTDLPQLEKAIEERDLKKSRELANKLQTALRQLEPKYANNFSGKLQLLQNQLKELQDWQEFATLPKLEQLCASMEQLITTSLPAPQKASAIRELQEQWRSMKLPQSTTAQELWTRFKQASDTAYAPCAEYFANEKTTRAFNLAQRQTICESLEAYYQHNWGEENSTHTINWKGLAQIITTAKQEFHKFHPIERSDEKPIRERFDKALNLLNKQLHDEYQRNESQKQCLIDQVNQLLDSDDVQKAIDATRAAQQQWKTIGITRRTQDQKLWEAFQQSCNAVFEKRQQSRQQEQQQQLDLLASAESLCEQIKALGDLADTELSQSKDTFTRLQEQFHALGEFGDKQRTQINRKFSNACDYYRKQLGGIAQREQQRQLQTVEGITALCQQLEYQPDSTAIEQLINQWESSGLSGKYLAMLQPRYQQALAIARGEASADFSANEQQRRQLLIELEILTDSDTPEEDRQQRRDYQMQSLQKNFGKTASNPREKKEKLLQDWYALGAAAPTVQPLLQARFDKLKNL